MVDSLNADFEQIPREPPIRNVPLMITNSTKLRGWSLRKSLSLPASTLLPPLMTQFSTNDTLSSECQCPHVMIADDNPLEAFYYQIFFQKSMNLENVENFRLLTCNSGEDLIKNYKAHKACGCGSVVLIVSDYSMGKNKFNGVETISKLRDLGYRGSLVLRTSETQQYLLDNHHNLEWLIKTGTITCLLDKTDHKKTKETLRGLIQNYMQ